MCTPVFLLLPIVFCHYSWLFVPRAVSPKALQVIKQKRQSLLRFAPGLSWEAADITFGKGVAASAWRLTVGGLGFRDGRILVSPSPRTTTSCFQGLGLGVEGLFRV